MVNASALARYLVYSLLILGEVCSSHLANEGEWKRNQFEPRQLSQYTRIAQGLLRSDKIVRFLSDIPCDIIHTLENDAEEAKKFIEDLENGDVPTIIKDLPEEIIGAFSDIIRIFASLPTQIVGAAEAVVTDAVNLFNDIESGAIVSDLEKLPGVIVSDITNAWGDLTSGLVDDWNAATDAIACLIEGCVVTTTAADRSCGATQAITAQASIQSSLPSSTSAIQPTSPPLSSALSPTQTRPKTSSIPVQSAQLSSPTLGSSSSPAINVAGSFKINTTILRLNIFQMCWLLGMGLLEAIFLL